MPISTTTAGIVLSYSVLIDATPVLTVYGTTNASGAITKGPVGVDNGADVVLAPQREATSTRPLVALVGRVSVRVSLEGCS